MDRDPVPEFHIATTLAKVLPWYFRNVCGPFGKDVKKIDKINPENPQ
jgi:hypothetical protein